MLACSVTAWELGGEKDVQLRPLNTCQVLIAHMCTYIPLTPY